MTPDLCSLKSDVRRAMKMRRAEAHAKNPQAGAELRAMFLGNISLPSNSIIASYVASGSEIDPGPLTDALRAAGHRIALPVIVGRGETLIFRAHIPKDELIPGPFGGIPQPAATAPEVAPTVLLVPLLAFDHTRQRLGYGGGYYDRTLAALRQQAGIMAIGLGFPCQQVPAIPVSPTDEVLDQIVTTHQLF